MYMYVLKLTWSDFKHMNCIILAFVVRFYARSIFRIPFSLDKWILIMFMYVCFQNVPRTVWRGTTSVHHVDPRITLPVWVCIQIFFTFVHYILDKNSIWCYSLQAVKQNMYYESTFYGYRYIDFDIYAFFCVHN